MTIIVLTSIADDAISAVVNQPYIGDQCEVVDITTKEAGPVIRNHGVKDITVDWRNVVSNITCVDEEIVINVERFLPNIFML